MRKKALKPTKFKKFKRKIFGFDIETANNNKEFVLASIVGENYQKVFHSPIDFAEEVKGNPIFKNSVIFATNLGFDFFGTFFNSGEAKYFNTLFRGSSLIKAKTWFYKGSFHQIGKIKTKTLKSITFLDTVNYAKMSVKGMGEVLGYPKYEAPSVLGKHPTNEKEMNDLIQYNIRDSEISFKFAQFLIDSFEDIGATFKDTIASTAMSLFKNKYLKDIYFQDDIDSILELFESYYGGRTEALKRGTIKDYNYYDINSLYPSVMKNMVFPNPNSKRTTYSNTRRYIDTYEGASKVIIECPNMDKPLLPYRQPNGRVVFPTGKIQGWYTHVELRKAMELGYILIKVEKTHYYTSTIKPFEHYMNDLYNLRKNFKKTNSPMELTVKLLMNSLYGKFAQRFIETDNWMHENTVSYKMIQNADSIERKGEFIRIVSTSSPSAFCIPIWASYTTAYGRLELYKYIEKYDPCYLDTDSIITKQEINTGKELGEMKLEMKVKEGIIVRPKFYALIADKGEIVKIKGLGKRLSYLEFVGLMHHPICKYDKFTKFKEALRRDLIPNEIINVSKEFSLEDEKRLWPNEFDHNRLEESQPLLISPNT